MARRAGPGQLEGAIRARSRPTSLARFATNATKEGVALQVGIGTASFIPRAFLIKLRAGSNADTKANMGLALRLKPGETVRNKTQAVQMARGLYLLYGPSVQQAFLNNDNMGVARDIEDELGDIVETEFMRQLELE